MKKIWLGTSWKMNKTRAEVKSFNAELVKKLALIDTQRIQPFIIPPFPYISQCVHELAAAAVLVGAQNMCWRDAGAFTGEVSPLMIKDCGATLVEIGHSERREMFGETDHTVNLKVDSAATHGLTPLLCVGDTAQEKQWKVSRESVVRQVKIALHGLAPHQAAQVIIAYEPVWAIGVTGTAAREAEAEAVCAHIRAALRELYGAAQALGMAVLYGGSVDHDNANAFLKQANIDGLFAGRGAQNAADFLVLLHMAQDTTTAL